MNIVWTKVAIESFKEIILFFQKEDVKIASNIGAAILSKIDLLLANQFLGTKYFLKNVRKLKVNKFPFSIYYRVKGQKIEILRIRHDARKPVPEFH